MSRLGIEKMKSYIKGDSFSADKLAKELSKFASDKEGDIARAETMIQQRRPSAREMRGGGDLNQIVLLYYLENANKFDDALIMKAGMLGMGVPQALVLFLLYGTKDLAEFCKQSGISHRDFMELLNFKKASALYNLNHNF